MIRSIKITGYRAFSDFALEGLGRVNLFVGKNNTGKTSLLEALSLLWAGSDIGALWSTLARRGEQPVPEVVPGRPIIQEVDVAHFFTGHVIKPGSEFSITTSNETPDRAIRYRVDETKPDESQGLFAHLASMEPGGSALALRITGPTMPVPAIPLTGRGTLRNDTFQQASNLARTGAANESNRAQYVTTSSLAVGEILGLWNDISLQPEEELVMKALRFIDSNIERIAPMTASFFLGNRGGFWLKRVNENRVPIGSMGEGIWRLLALSVGLGRAKDSILLVDEIDTGLHYTVMADIWKFISDVSKEFRVQVFATTHSYDCVHSLAKVCRDIEDAMSEISVHRIEADKTRSIPFTEAEIRIAAERQIEIR